MPSNSELINERMTRRLAKIYEQAEYDMLSAVKKRIARGVTDSGFYEQKLMEVQDLKKQFTTLMYTKHKLAKHEVSKGLVDSYFAGKDEVKLKPRKGMPDIISRDLVPYKLQRQILETERLIDGTTFQILRNVDDVYREVQSNVSSQVLAGTTTTKGAVQQALNQFAAKGVTGFVDKLGRKWNLQSYTTMAVRTNAQHAALQGHLDRMQELGRDLVKVSVKLATCPICAPWSNKILSISCENIRYPSLESAKAAKLFHPNCQHTLLDYDEDDEELDSILGIDTNKKTGYDTLPKNNDEIFAATQKQRDYENKIRYWKRLDAVALEPAQHKQAQAKIKTYGTKIDELVAKYPTMQRDRANEGVMRGDASKVDGYSKASAKLKPLDLVNDKVQVTTSAPVPKTVLPVPSSSTPVVSKVATTSTNRTVVTPSKSVPRGELIDEYIKSYKEVMLKKGASFASDPTDFIEKKLISTPTDKVVAGIKKMHKELGLTPKKPVKVPKTKIVQEVRTATPKKVPITSATSPKSLENFNTRKEEFYKKYKEVLSENKIDIDKTTEVVKSFVKDADLRMRIPNDVIDKVLGDGYFKNQFETKTSGGYYDLETRKNTTKKLFGSDVNSMKRNEFEKYGYLFKGNVDDDYTDGRVSGYGNTIVQFKKKKLEDRTTFTIGDSLYASGKEVILPSKLNEVTPSWDFSSSTTLKYMQELDGTNFTHIDFRRKAGVGYIEAQYHGDVTLDDVDYIVLNESDYARTSFHETAKKIKEKGIKVKLFNISSELIDL